jgi:hypothetical protein
MTNYRKQRAERKRLRMSAMGKASQRVQADRRMEHMAERLREMAEWDVQNLPRKQGDALGCLQWTDFGTGKVRRWTVRIGSRRCPIKKPRLDVVSHSTPQAPVMREGLAGTTGGN